MARYPGATWRDAHVRPGDRSNGNMRSYQWAVLHVNVSNGNLFNWVNNPANEMSCHFEVYKDGSIEQYIDTSQSSWCQQNGNNDGLSIETEGYPEEPLTSAQVNAIGQLLRWMAQTHGIPLQISDNPATPGFAWHGEGGNNWGGHPSCPGELRKAQRAQMLNIAGGTSGSGDGTQIGEDMYVDSMSDSVATQIASKVATWPIPVGSGSQGIFWILSELYRLAAGDEAQFAAITAALAKVQPGGSPVPVDEHQLALDLAASLNQTLPAAVISALKAAL